MSPALSRSCRTRGCTGAPINILDTIADPNLFGSHFQKDESWVAWKVFLAALFGLPLSDEQLAIFKECTGRETPPAGGTNEAWLVCGRRGGKSFVLSVIAVFLAAFKDWRRYLGPGERATVMVVAAARKQARVIMRFIMGLLSSSPILKQLIENETRESVSLRNRINIEIHTASFKSTRGYTVVAALLDELAFWSSDDSAEPDEEVIAAIRPGMSTIPGAMLLCASSPHARKGALWNAYHKFFAKDGPILVWQAPTRTMNPSVPQSWIDAEIERDPAKNTAEYLAQFRTDVETFVNREAVRSCISTGIRERPPQPNTRYFGFVDMSGGSVDSAALAIAHSEEARQTIVTDCIRERKAPHSPEDVIEEFSKIIKQYGIFKITGDRYGGEWPREQFGRFGISYEPSQKAKSALYIDCLPLINSARLELLDDGRSFNQLCALERRTGRGRGDVIDHPPNGHDDLINAIAGAAVSAVYPHGSYDASYRWVSGGDVDDQQEVARAWRMARLMQHIASHW